MTNLSVRAQPQISTLARPRRKGTRQSRDIERGGCARDSGKGRPAIRASGGRRGQGNYRKLVGRIAVVGDAFLDRYSEIADPSIGQMATAHRSMVSIGWKLRAKRNGQDWGQLRRGVGAQLECGAGRNDRHGLLSTKKAERELHLPLHSPHDP